MLFYTMPLKICLNFVKLYQFPTSNRQQTDLNSLFLISPSDMTIFSEYSIDGVIIPDIPFEERGKLLPFSNKYGVDIISLIAPSSKERIAKIASSAQGFVYCVSSMGVTRVRNEIKTDLTSIISAIKATTNVPIAAGFGISTPQQASEISAYADGIIVGSAIVKIIEEYGDNATKPLYEYVRAMKQAIG